jgi:branched-subunit amino acid aminotransferase/4-amino-4-deoxychorismate lyase
MIDQNEYRLVAELASTNLTPEEKERLSEIRTDLEDLGRLRGTQRRDLLQLAASYGLQ